MATRTPPDGPISRRHPSVAAMRRLRDEIDKLNQEHSEALKSATFVGMTSHQASEYESRRKRITRLTQQLMALETPQ